MEFTKTLIDPANETFESQNESLPSRTPSDSPGRTENDNMKSLNDFGLEECSSPSLPQISSTTASDLSGAPGLTSFEVILQFNLV